MSKRSVLTFALVLIAGASAPLYAQDADRRSPNATEIAKWSIITAGFALAFAAGLGALAQGRGRRVGRRSDRPQPRRRRRHPRRADPRSRADRVARHLRAAHLADPVLPASRSAR